MLSEVFLLVNWTGLFTLVCLCLWEFAKLNSVLSNRQVPCVDVTADELNLL